MRALLDINVMIALFDPDHPGHRSAHAWLNANRGAGWASCPITQNGVLRIMSQSAYPNPLCFDVVFQRLQEATEHASHEFWPDDISLLDSIALDRAVTPAGRQVTDLYLLALSVSHKGRFATFDRTVPLNLVLRANARHLVVLSP